MTSLAYDHYRQAIEQARRCYHRGNCSDALCNLGEAAGIAWVFYCQTPPSMEGVWHDRREWALLCAEWVRTQSMKRRLP